MKIELKVTLRTSENQGLSLHTHERFFEDGVIPAGTYRVDSDVASGPGSDDDHAFTLEEDVQPGSSVTLRTTANGTGPHDHELTVRAIEVEDDGETEEDAVHRPEDRKSATDQMETKRLGGKVIETKVAVVNGVQVGVIEAYLATWTSDTGGMFGVPDQFVRGAFLESLADHVGRNNRQVRLKDMHGRVIGGFPIELVFEDEVGLRAVGNINLETQLGQEAWALIKQGVLTDMSVGFSSLDDLIEGGLRQIFKAVLWEASIVDEPANREAMILEFRSALPFEDLPIADRNAPWDPVTALNRVREYSVKQSSPDTAWKKAFVHVADGSLQHAIVDVVEDRLVVIPKAVLGVCKDVRDAEFEGKAAVIRHLERYLQKMGIESPFPVKDRQFFGIDEAKSLDESGFSEALRRGAAFSKGAARLMASRVPASQTEDSSYASVQISRVLENLRECKRLLRDGRVLRS